MLGNVSWSGVRLSEVLTSVFPRLQSTPASSELHVVFEGADGYESSTPLTPLLAADGDCLLATHMNGEPLAPDHGFPCRVLLPGIAGARSVKWITSIRLSDTPSAAPWNAHYYKHADGSEVSQLPLQSLILHPQEGEVVAVERNGRLFVQGVAYSSGGGQISAVEVSSDDGRNWCTAQIFRDEVPVDDSRGKHSWLRWAAQVPIPHTTTDGTQAPCSLCCRAVDASGVSQPRVSKKQRGYLYNGWCSVNMTAISREG